MALEKITIPDFGDVQEITVVEVFIAPGDTVAREGSLIALESEKAVMDLPSPFAGTIKEVLVKPEQVVKSGDVIATMEVADKGETVVPARADETPSEPAAAPVESPGMVSEKQPSAQKIVPPEKKVSSKQIYHATPSVRALAREKGVELADLVGSGPQGRILREDVLSGGSGKSPLFFAEHPLEDFSKYGPVEEVPLSRIKKISGQHLHRSWVTIPHVTHFDEADMTDVETFRQDLNGSLREGEGRYSPLVFIVRALVSTLKSFPMFNSSLVPGGEKAVLKKYYHIGIAVDTPDGLVVPVLKDANTKGLAAIRDELQRLSAAARQGKLAIPDMQGAGFTISSLGGIGGTGFTPIVNSPQVAILGLSRSSYKPTWDGSQFLPRMVMPFSLSYDHRIIDGADAARFCRALATNIEDLKRNLI
jgi:pyruvate dehydrogenase E2 component (dihydrolipoamide acetyltransferase)